MCISIKYIWSIHTVCRSIYIHLHLHRVFVDMYTFIYMSMHTECQNNLNMTAGGQFLIPNFTQFVEQLTVGAGGSAPTWNQHFFHF